MCKPVVSDVHIYRIHVQSVTLYFTCLTCENWQSLIHMYIGYMFRVPNQFICDVQHAQSNSFWTRAIQGINFIILNNHIIPKCNIQQVTQWLLSFACDLPNVIFGHCFQVHLQVAVTHSISYVIPPKFVFQTYVLDSCTVTMSNFKFSKLWFLALQTQALGTMNEL